MDTHFTISAGMPHRKMMKQLAEIHREKEKKIKNDDTKEFQEYPNDFEEEQEENPHNYNIFEALEGRKKKNFLDLIKLCENQLQTVHSHGIFLFCFVISNTLY